MTSTHRATQPSSRVLVAHASRRGPTAQIAERMMPLAPAGRDALPAGDFRDWPAIDAWADEIAAELRRPERPTTGRRRA